MREETGKEGRKEGRRKKNEGRRQENGKGESDRWAARNRGRRVSR